MMKSALLTVLLLLSCAAVVRGQTNQSPFNTPQMNSTLYVGSLTGGATQVYPTIQSAVTTGCAATTKITVEIPIAYSGTDTIPAITGGCTATGIVDRRQFPSACYSWSGSVYGTTPCSSAAAAGSLYSLQFSNAGTLAATNFKTDSGFSDLLGVGNLTAQTLTLSNAFNSVNPALLHQDNMTVTGNVSGSVLQNSTISCFGAGYDLGNLGGAATCNLLQGTMFVANRGNADMYSGNMLKTSVGDTSADYNYLHAFGGLQTSSDEGVEDTVSQTFQLGYMTATLASATQGTNPPYTTSITSQYNTNTHTYLVCTNGDCTATSSSTWNFADGGILLDTKNATPPTVQMSTISNSLDMQLFGSTVTPSSAYGSISSCSAAGTGQFQTYTLTSCQVVLGSGSGNFVAQQDACLSGSFQEEVYITTIATAQNEIVIAFNSRYPWPGVGSALIMQGGLCGQAVVETNTLSTVNSVKPWPVAWAIVGSYTANDIVISNCAAGGCGSSGSYVPSSWKTYSNSNPIYPVAVTRNASNVVQASLNQGGYNPLSGITAGMVIVASGCTPADFNGQFTVATAYESLDVYYATWTQTGTAESGSCTTLSSVPTSLTLYPAAFIIGTNGGVSGDATLATNTVNFAAGDPVVGAPTSEYQSSAQVITYGQSTPLDLSHPSSGLQMNDYGPISPLNDIIVSNKGTGNTLLGTSGQWQNFLSMSNRPYNSVISIGAGGGPASYFLWKDASCGGCSIYSDYTNSSVDFGGSISVPGAVNVGVGNGGSGGVHIGANTVVPDANNHANLFFDWIVQQAAIGGYPIPSANPALCVNAGVTNAGGTGKVSPCTNIDGTIIGANTPSTGAFTTLKASTMPAAGDSSTSVPDTAWVSAAISAASKVTEGTPASSSAACTAPAIEYDSNYAYYCIPTSGSSGAGTWARRAASTSW